MTVPVPVITTLAEYQTRFWIDVARQLARKDLLSFFISFDDRSAQMIADAGFVVRNYADIGAVAVEEQNSLFAQAGVPPLAQLAAHERFAFGRSDDDAMADKLARSIKLTQDVLNLASDIGKPVVIQEVGGFLSVIGAYYATKAAGLQHWFIEPSFFRGRMIVGDHGFAAPSFPRGMEATPGREVDEYLRDTLDKGSLVIPEKDRHQYTTASRKMFTRRNARRLVEKSIDKYILGKRQEFGFIGGHVATHARTVVNSARLSSRYTALDQLDRFFYYPLHVPGDMALTLRSPQYLDQLALVDYICRNLPDGYRLALKEHPAMVGMVDTGRLKEVLDRYPQLALIDPKTNNYEIMRKAEAIITVNSKSGAEAGLLGRRVLVLGDAFYALAPFARFLANLTELPAAMSDLDALPAPDESERFAWFAALWDQTIPGELYAEDPAKAETFAQSLMHKVLLVDQ